MRPDVVSFGTLITGCERAALWQQALQLLGELGRRRLEGNVVTYSAAISACEKAPPGYGGHVLQEFGAVLMGEVFFPRRPSQASMISGKLACRSPGGLLHCSSLPS